MGFLSSGGMGSALGSLGSMMTSAKKVASQGKSAFATLAPKQYESTANAANSIMSKYGRPIGQMVNTGHKFISNPRDAVGSFNNVFQNQSNMGLGYARDESGNMVNQTEATQAGYNVEPSRYGGNMVEGQQQQQQQPDQQMEEGGEGDYQGDDQNMQDPGEQQPVQYRGSAAKQQKRLAAGKQLKQKGSGLQKFKSIMGGIGKVGKGLMSMGQSAGKAAGV